MHEFAWIFLAQLSPLNFTSFPSFCFASFIFLSSFLLPLFPFVEFKLDIVTKIYRLRSMKRILARKSVRTFLQLGWLTLWTNDSLLRKGKWNYFTVPDENRESTTSCLKWTISPFVRYKIILKVKAVNAVISLSWKSITKALPLIVGIFSYLLIPILKFLIICYYFSEYYALVVSSMVCNFSQTSVLPFKS